MNSLVDGTGTGLRDVMCLAKGPKLCPLVFPFRSAPTGRPSMLAAYLPGKVTLAPLWTFPLIS